MTQSVFAADKPASSKGGSWSSHMQRMAAALAELIVDTSSDKQFNDPKNRARIAKNADSLAKTAHELKFDPGRTDRAGSEPFSPDADLSVGFISDLFKERTQRASAEFKRGNRDYARSLLRSVPSYCIACHSRTGQGPSFGDLPFDRLIEKLSRDDRAAAYAASRQYDKALSDYRALVADRKLLESDPGTWERALRSSLAIAVRVKCDPELAASFIQSAQSEKSLPEFIREDTEHWKRSLDAWKKEWKSVPSSEEGLIAEARRVFDEALKSQRYAADRGSDIAYLRATSLLHEFMGRYPSSQHVGEALLLLGSAYENLRDLRLWDLHDMMYETCIQQAPGSEYAKGCYRRLEESMYLGFSGSGGVRVPREVARKLEELRTIAFGKPAKP